MEDATQINFFIFIITIFYTGEQAVKKPFEIIASGFFFFFYMTDCTHREMKTIGMNVPSLTQAGNL